MLDSLLLTCWSKLRILTNCQKWEGSNESSYGGLIFNQISEIQNDLALLLEGQQHQKEFVFLSESNFDRITFCNEWQSGNIRRTDGKSVMHCDCIKLYMQATNKNRVSVSHVWVSWLWNRDVCLACAVCKCFSSWHHCTSFSHSMGAWWNVSSLVVEGVREAQRWKNEMLLVWVLGWMCAGWVARRVLSCWAVEMISDSPMWETNGCCE